jgi:mannose-6-phosphate isomerase-like protein (cupin superfamily)
VTTYLKPWGTHKVLYDTETYKVKLLYVYKGERISLQKHKNRVETWVVIKGHPKVVKGDLHTHLKPEDSIKIEKGEIHRIEAPEDDVTIIEVQQGICEEEDIERIQDDYKR